MTKILNWPNEEAFALYMERPIDVPDDHSVILSLRDEGSITLCIGGSCFSLEIAGNWEEMQEGDIVSITNDGTVSRLYRRGQSEIDIFVTNQCNSNCLMCPLAETVRRKKHPSQFQWITDYIRILPNDVPYINVTGGEPTLEKQRFHDVMRQLKMKFKKSEFQLLTNGRSFSDKQFLLTALENMPNHTRFAIPLHSGNETVHDNITQSAGSFRQTDKGIKNLLSNGQKVEIRVVLSKLNVSTLSETVKHIAEQYSGVFVVNFVGMEMMGNAARNREILWEDYDVLFDNARESIMYLISRGIDAQLYNFPLCAIDRGYWPLAAKSITDYKIRYKDECAICVARPMCGGFFMSTMKIMDPSIKVIDEL